MATQAPVRIRRNPNLNFGTVVDQLGGIQVGSGIILINLDTDRRFHNVRLQVTAVFYSGGTSLVATKITGAGTGLLVDATVNSTGIVTAIVPHAGAAGSGFVTGDTITFADATGKGFIGTVTASSGAVTAIAITSVGTPTAAPVQSVLGVVQLLVNGSPVGDLPAAMELNRAYFNGVQISLGQLPLFFTEPWRNITRWPAITSWDMAGQSTFAIKIAVNPGWQQVGVNGTYEYDFVRNTVQGEIDQQTFQAALAVNKAPAPVLHIVARHLFTPTLNAGVNILTGQQIPITSPILRMHCIGSTPGDLYQSILQTDNLTAEAGFVGVSQAGGQMDQLREELSELGFVTSIFDYSYVADKTQRISNCLKIASSLKWSLYSTISQGLTGLQERLQSTYS